MFVAGNSSSKTSNINCLLDSIIDEICQRLEIAGFFRSVCENCIHSLTSGASSTQFDSVLFTDVAIEHFCSSLVEMSSLAPGSLTALLRSLAQVKGRVSPQSIICLHVIPRVVQIFLTWLRTLEKGLEGESKRGGFSEHLALSDRLQEELTNIFGDDPSALPGRSIQNNAVFAKSKWLAGRFYIYCFNSYAETGTIGNKEIDSRSLIPTGGLSSSIDLVFATKNGGKPSSITDVVCICTSEMQFLLLAFQEAVKRGFVVDRQLVALAPSVDAVLSRLQVTMVRTAVLTLDFNKTNSELLLKIGDDSPGVSSILSAAWVVKAARMSLSRAKQEFNLKPSDVNLRELLSLRDRLCAQAEEISQISRGMHRIEMHKNLLMEYRSQISALIERKKEESSPNGVIRSDEEFLRYFTQITFRLQSIESKIFGKGVGLNMNMSFEHHSQKQKKLLQFPGAKATHRDNSLHSSTEMDFSKNGGASPLKIFMQNLFRPAPGSSPAEKK